MSFLLEKHFERNAFLLFLASPVRCAARSVNTFGVSPFLAWHATSQGKTCRKFTHKTFSLQESQLLSHHELLQSLAEKCGWDHVNHFTNLQNQKHQCNKDIHEVLRSQHAGQVATSSLHSPASRLLSATFGVSFPAEQA